MNRGKAKNILQVFGRPQFKIKDTVMSFARQTDKNLEEIENKTDHELVEHWKSLVFSNLIFGQVSLNEMQRISLIELELEERKNIKPNDLKTWFDEERNNFDERAFYGE